MSLDTRTLEDGRHRLTIRAQGENGRDGVEEISFQVQNGPGIVVSGLRPNSTRSGRVRFTVDAFSTDDPFDPRRAEARSSIPVWVWVMSLFVVAWAVWYAARMWDVPAEYSHTPTYSTQREVAPE
ncbi:MAG: cytochrome C [Gammaproteobacteria bacterium]